MDLRPGLLVTRNVRLSRPLGEGGMGTVWVGEHLALDTQVAVKFISPELSKDDPEILGRFQREAKIAARIKSQHVVQVFDHGVTEDGTPFIVMELLDGSSLAEWLALTGTLTPEETATLVGQVAGVLGKAHELGVVHRDIKPENVFLVDSEDRLFAKVLDFGIAKQTRVPKGSLKTGTGVIIGTPDYMSPEQLLRASEVDFKIDLWALAVVAYRAMTGRCPFVGETVPAMIVSITEGVFPPPSRVAPRALPAALDGWFARALAREPRARFGSARELAESFAVAVGLPPGASAPSTARRQAGSARGATPRRDAAVAPPAPGPPPGKAGPAAAELAKVALNRMALKRVAVRKGAPARIAREEDPPPRAAASGGRADRGTATAEPAGEQAPLEAAPPPPRRKRASDDRAMQATDADAREVARARAVPSREPRGPTSPISLELAAPVRESARKPRGPLARAGRAPGARGAGSGEQADGSAVLVATVVEIVPAVLVVAAAAASGYLLEPSGQQWLAAGSRTMGLGLGAITAIVLGVGCWRVGAAARRDGVLSLWLAVVGLGALGVAAGLTAFAAHGQAGPLVALLPSISRAAPIAAAVVAVAFGVFGLTRAVAELRGFGSARHTRGAILIVLSLAAIGLGYRVALRSPLLRDEAVSRTGAPGEPPRYDSSR